MKKNILLMAALLMASATVFTACSSDDNIISEPQPAQPTGKYTMTVEASKGDDAANSRTTRALSITTEGGKNTLNATWATTENVYVKKGSGWATGSLKPQADGATATLKGTLSDVTIAAGDELTLQFPRSGERDYTGQVGTLEDIAAKYDYATADVTVASVDGSGNITVSDPVTFENQQSIVKFTLKDKANNAAISASKLVVNDGTNNYTVTPASATSELYVALPDVSDKTLTLTATVGTYTYIYEKSGVTFTNGQYYEITVKMTKTGSAPAGATAVDLGLSVKWANMNVGATSETGYGLFFAWGGTTGYGSDTSDGHNFDWAHTPYYTGDGTNHSWSKYTGSDTKLQSIDDAATVNWGSNWRMPTKTEMDELLATKSNTTDYTWTWTTVDGHSGYRITYKTNSNSIFLPASGRRSGTLIYYQGTDAYYWTSSLNESKTYEGCHLYFSSSNVTGGTTDRYHGRTVRAVKKN